MADTSKEDIEENEEGLKCFLNTCKRILDLHVSCKQKKKALFKEIMTRTKLLLKDRSEENQKMYL